MPEETLNDALSYMSVGMSDVAALLKGAEGHSPFDFARSAGFRHRKRSANYKRRNHAKHRR